MEANAIAVIAREVRSLWFDGLATLRSCTNTAPASQNPSASQKALRNKTTTADRDAAGHRYSFDFTNGLQTIQGGRDLEFSSDRAARREALRTARQMANNVSWEASARGGGWTVLVINPSGQQISAVRVRIKRRWF